MDRILYDSRDCPYGMKVRIVLAEKELEYDLVLVDLKAGQQRMADFLKLNPFGKVPVLADADTVIYDSRIINEYLNEEYPGAMPLLPDDSSERARVRLLEDYADVAFTLPAMAIERELEKPSEERDQTKLATAQDVVRKGLAMLERELDGREYLGGAFTMADVAFAPTVLQLDKLGIRVEASQTNLKSWINRLAARASIGAVLKAVA
jgi:glutathione S-transferase